MQEEDGKTEMDMEGTLVIYEANNDDVLPLTMVKDSREEAQDTTEIIRNKDDLSHNIAKVTVEGDLSLQQTGKLKESHTKPKKKGRELNTDQALSRSVNTQKAFTRLVNMHKRYQFYFVGLMEPFEDSQNLEEFRRKLGMKHVAVNTNRKIWVFIDEFIDYEIV
ncbi:hypothetical protein H5410_018203 [Solanum commersonii]|uniref:Uncharacterized protein n=1 Tax=Solanum commersonii TaxID=4109 RepID=A0A9J6A264_SOLCO|nr:hypothetical protein H5410_018203 [Solanum commersonii]